MLYNSAQHAREWITPEMTRRLMRHVHRRLQHGDPQIRSSWSSTELWFVPVANPDGYDYTFTTDRLWRKNLRDNDGDGQITGADGVDLNRNFPTKWGYDNEGSSPSPDSETYRGPAPASEPETRALDGLMGGIGFEFLINYHSAAELLLYGTGWQVATPTPDDVLYEVHGRRRREARGARLRPGHLRRAVHDQRRDDRARPGGLRHARVHPGDVDLPDGQRRSTRTTPSNPRTAAASSISPTPSR